MDVQQCIEFVRMRAEKFPIHLGVKNRMRKSFNLFKSLENRNKGDLDEDGFHPLRFVILA
jgi:hypothetical protein